LRAHFAAPYSAEPASQDIPPGVPEAAREPVNVPLDLDCSVLDNVASLPATIRLHRVRRWRWFATSISDLATLVPLAY